MRIFTHRKKEYQWKRKTLIGVIWDLVMYRQITDKLVDFPKASANFCCINGIQLSVAVV